MTHLIYKTIIFFAVFTLTTFALALAKAQIKKKYVVRKEIVPVAYVCVLLMLISVAAIINPDIYTH